MAILRVAPSPNKSNSERFIESLKIKRSTSALLKRVGKEVCPICLDDFDVNEKVCFLDCTHMFHQNCIVEWLRGKNTCPLCRCILYENPHHSIVQVGYQRQSISSFPRMSVRQLSLERISFTISDRQGRRWRIGRRRAIRTTALVS